MLDMDHRLGPVRRLAIGVLALAAIAQAPWFGWWTILPLLFLLLASYGFVQGNTMAGALNIDRQHRPAHRRCFSDDTPEIMAAMANRAPPPIALPRTKSLALTGSNSCKVSPARSDANWFSVNG